MPGNGPSPQARGDTAPGNLHADVRGPSPRARGRPGGARPIPSHRRTIPADAGATSGLTVYLQKGADHPRRREGDLRRPRTMEPIIGPSPRPQGRRGVGERGDRGGDNHLGVLTGSGTDGWPRRPSRPGRQATRSGKVCWNACGQCAAGGGEQSGRALRPTSRISRSKWPRRSARSNRRPSESSKPNAPEPVRQEQYKDASPRSTCCEIVKRKCGSSA